MRLARPRRALFQLPERRLTAPSERAARRQPATVRSPQNRGTHLLTRHLVSWCMIRVAPPPARHIRDSCAPGHAGERSHIRESECGTTVLHGLQLNSLTVRVSSFSAMNSSQMICIYQHHDLVPRPFFSHSCGGCQASARCGPKSARSHHTEARRGLGRHTRGCHHPGWITVGRWSTDSLTCCGPDAGHRSAVSTAPSLRRRVD